MSSCAPYPLAWRSDLGHSGNQVLVTSDFTPSGGVHREQVFQVGLGTTTATLNGWTSTDFYIHCADSLPLYVQDATYSPDDSTVYIATTGYKQPSDPLHPGLPPGHRRGLRHRRHQPRHRSRHQLDPTHSRGVGADDLVLAFNGFWIASDDKMAPPSTAASTTQASTSCRADPLCRS